MVGLLLCAGVQICAMEKDKDEHSQQKHLLEPVETEKAKKEREWREDVERFRTYDLDQHKFDPQKHFLETGET